MKFSYLRRGVMLALALGAVSCTEPSAAPTAPTSTPVFGPKVTGLFQGTLQVADVQGGTGPLANAGLLSCVHNAYLSAVPQTNDVNLIVSSTDGVNVTARMTSASTGLSCDYTGVVSNSGLSLAGPAGSCTDASVLPIAAACPGGTTAELAKMQLVGSSITGTFDGWPVNVTALRGRAALTYALDDGSSFVVSFNTAQNPFVLNKR
jgi:hypothetical protein